MSTKTMKAAQVLKHGDKIQIVDVPVQQPGPGQILVKIEVTGVCHTDLHVLEGDWKVQCPLPMTPGHEGVGTVVSLGSGVTNLKIGDRVCVPWLHKSCGCCEQCWGGWETVCGNQQRTGFTTHGTFAEYCLADAAYVGIVPKNLPSEQAAPITCAGVTVYKGLKVSEVKPGQWVVIVGAAGGLGHAAVQYANAMGMKVIGVDVGSSKVEFMRSLGCAHVIDPIVEDVVAKVKEYTGGVGANGCLILVPCLDAITKAVSYMCPRGVVVPIALPPGNIQADLFDVILNAITIRGSIVGTRLDLQEALQLAADGKVKCKVEIRKFSEVQSVLDDLKAGKIEGRVVLEMPK